MVRVIEKLEPDAWSTVLPVTARPGIDVRSHLAVVDQAQQEYHQRDDAARAQAAEVRSEALRRLGRETDDAEPSVVELEALPEPEPERPRRAHGFLARRRQKREPDVAAQEVGEVAEVAVIDLVEEPEPEPEPRPRQKRRLRSRRHAKPQPEMAAVVDEVASEPEEVAQRSDAVSEIKERIAEYAPAFERRSGRDRRCGRDRRQAQSTGFDSAADRRAGGERRSSFNRRRARV